MRSLSIHSAVIIPGGSVQCVALRMKSGERDRNLGEICLHFNSTLIASKGNELKGSTAWSESLRRMNELL